MKITEPTKVYIAGCGGMLGRAVYEVFNSKCTVKATDIDLNIDWLEYADVRDYNDINTSILAFSPDVIINLAALTDLEHCEKNQEDSWLTNALGAENIAIIAKRLNIPMVYISTAGIFDGLKDIYVSQESLYGKFLHKDIKVSDTEEGTFKIGTELNDALSFGSSASSSLAFS